MSSLNERRLFDADAARARLGATRGPVFWRALEELAGSEDFKCWLRSEHPQLEEVFGLDRREFFKMLGASIALAGIGACSHPPQTEIVPYVNAPDGQVDGVPRFFATVLAREGYGHGVLVESNMGRPTKVEGNPQHPASLGSTDIFDQAAVLQLWDPDRSQTVLHRGTPATWSEFDGALLDARARFDRNEGAGLRVLTGAVTSPTLIGQLEALLRRYPQAHWHVHQPLGNANAMDGTKLAFGQPYSMRLLLDRAEVILALDADFLVDSAAGVRYARDFAGKRTPEERHGAMSRLYVVEPTPSITGAMADHRLMLETFAIEGLARYLASHLGIEVTAEEPLSPALTRWADAVLADLRQQQGKTLVVVGATQQPAIHALGHAMNAALGNTGHTLRYHDPVERVPGDGELLPDLVEAMRAREVDTLLVLDANPAYDAPSDLRFYEAAGHIPHLLHLGLYNDETGALAEWHLPQTHELEAWSDIRAFDGTAAIAQPLIAPLYGGRSAHEVLALLLGDVTDGRQLVRRRWAQTLPDEPAWSAALQAGLISGTASAERAPVLRAGVSHTARARTAPDDSTLEILFRADPTIGDGRWANNGWLQELPKPLTQLTWDNAALVSPQLAKQLFLTNGDVIELRMDGRSTRAPVWIMPGQAPRSVTLHLGYGRRSAGHVGSDLGFDAYGVRSSTALWSATGASVQKVGNHYEFASTQQHFGMEGRELVRVRKLADLADAAHAREEHHPLPSLYAEQPPGEYAWGMSIDLNTCIGCKVCTIACQAENNIPIVGKDQVRRGREMHWIRVDRYYEGTPDNPRTYAQPVPCMMCEHAPCELVCPVDATVHDSEGLNLQVYNRCVGTRFCSNNCPYKVRRFNFLQYVNEDAPTLAAQRNPEVTVRRRGVMEKCTYCIQRIEAAHIDADRAGRRIRDGEVLTACQAACPTQAIRFGDVADQTSAVARSKALPRNYVLLEELNTRPRTSYLMRVRNPNPALEEN